MQCALGLMVAAAMAAPLAAAEMLVYHEIQTGADGQIVPWFSPDPARAYDHNIRLLWQFWRTMKPCPNGVPYYMQHQVWKPEHDGRGLGGDQINMALSSWTLLYGYLGDEAVKANMIFMADYWLEHGMSPADAKWANLPYPYNTDLHAGQYDGDMRAGKGYLQPDKAASFGAELVHLHKMTGQGKYLDAAVRIANTLAANITPGDQNNSPWPFRVHAVTNQIHEQTKQGKVFRASYTANWTGALCLFDELIALKQGKVDEYALARDVLVRWIKSYPLKTNNWGPFFEDIPTADVSNTETNADTMAMYILEHPQWDAQGLQQAKGILDWSLKNFANPKWQPFGVTPINEQTVYKVPGNSHTSRHASVELLYCEKSGELSPKVDAIARLNWATYMVDADGKNRYYNDDIWLTDGYGDYIRHYLRAMASFPELAPADQNHLLQSSSIIQ
ncbi:MAG TPA: hypothetical protein VHP11_05555, partial [Tepidisphaeraceae bacterium]|nr:hypothetical protein [Tepidisphaeraceae bacterium]